MGILNRACVQNPVCFLATSPGTPLVLNIMIKNNFKSSPLPIRRDRTIKIIIEDTGIIMRVMTKSITGQDTKLGEPSIGIFSKE